MKKTLSFVLILTVILTLFAGAAIAEDYHVGFALRTTNGAYYAAIADGVTASCNELGWKCTVLNAADDTAKELENMESLVAAGVDFIFLDCVDPSAATASQRVAFEAGIPLVNLDSGVNDTSMQVTTVYSDNLQNGLAVGSYYAATLDADYEIVAACLSGNTGSIAGQQRSTGQIAGIIMTRTGCTEDEAWVAAEAMYAELATTGKAYNEAAKFEIYGQGWGNWNVDEGLAAAEDLITANPELNLIFAENDPMLMGAMIALDNAGITYGNDGVVKIISAADGSKDGYDAIKAGKIMAIGENSPVLVGMKGMEIAEAILIGGVDPESYEDVTMTAAVAVTIENVDEHYEFGF